MIKKLIDYAGYRALGYSRQKAWELANEFSTEVFSNLERAVLAVLGVSLLLLTANLMIGGYLDVKSEAAVGAKLSASVAHCMRGGLLLVDETETTRTTMGCETMTSIKL